MRKIIITLLLLFLFFGIKEEVLAAFDEDYKPSLTSPADNSTDITDTTFNWNSYNRADSFKFKIWGSGKREEVCIDRTTCPVVGNPRASDANVYAPGVAYLNYGYKNPCRYSWQVQAFEGCNCQNKHSKWSDTWSLTTRPTPTNPDSCPTTPGAPGVVTGAPIECCKLKYSFEDVDENCEKDNVVGAPDYRTCNWTPDATTTRWSVCCFLNSLYKISDWLTWLVLPLAILVSLAGAFTLATSGGNPEKVNKGKDLIVWAFVGAVLCFLIKAILAIIKTVV